MWQGLKTITDSKGKPIRELPSDASLPDELNAFYARFKASNTEACVITLLVADVSRTFKQVSIHKVAGPDRLPGRVLKACAGQLASVFTDIFNLSLTESVIPRCFKQTTIVPVPKEVKVTCLNYYHPVALTSVAMKCFERLLMSHINTINPRPTPICIPPQQGQASCHPGPLYQAVSEEGPKNCQGSSYPSHSRFSLLPHGKRVPELQV